MFNLEARLKQSEPLLQYTKELRAQVCTLCHTSYHGIVNMATMSKNVI